MEPFHVYTYAHIQRLIDERSGGGIQSISRFKYQCENMTFSDQSRYNIMLQKVVHKVGESAIN